MTMMADFEQVFERQRELQRIHGFPIDSINPNDQNRMAEVYVFKAIEEAIELRRTQPSVMIPMAKVQPKIDRSEMLKELCDTFLYLFNFMIVRRINFDELMAYMNTVQENNMAKAHEKQRAFEEQNS